MIRKCFTINPLRTKEDILSYEEHLIKTNLFVGCEIFYPYNVSNEQYQDYCDGIKSYLKYDNFEIVCHLPHGKENNIASYNNLDNIMNRYYKAIEFSAMFNVHKLTLHPGELDGTLSKEEAIKLSIENVKKLSSFCKQYNMTIMIENLVGSNELCLTKEEMKEYLEHFDHQVLMTFDCGHCHASHTLNKTPINEFVLYLKDYLAHLHLSDNHGLKDEHQTLGSGTIDFVSYFQTLKNLNYQGLYSSEVLFNSYEDLILTSKKIDEIEKKGGN